MHCEEKGDREGERVAEGEEVKNTRRTRETKDTLSAEGDAYKREEEGDQGEEERDREARGSTLGSQV